MSKLRYAILGSGMMGHEHIRNIHLLEETEVSAVSDPDEGMREKAVSLTDGRAKAFTDHRDLLASGIADVLVIASPNHTHVDLLPDALSSGLPILVEKPLCTTVPDCEASQSGTVVQSGFSTSIGRPLDKASGSKSTWV